LAQDGFHQAAGIGIVFYYHNLEHGKIPSPEDIDVIIADKYKLSMNMIKFSAFACLRHVFKIVTNYFQFYG
jgi:hypothetical protein